jgi:formylglycine-generating enzyme required for sulfatase activity
MPGEWCIDSTEVTRDAYRDWLQEGPVPSRTGSCGLNTSLEPHCTWEETGDLPATCIDWCDAADYCRAKDKRLCGSPGGGPTPYASYTDVSQSQWHAACTSGGMYPYVYGTAYSAGMCVDDTTSLLPVRSKLTCQSPATPYRCVFDLNGNAWEWEDSCRQAGAETQCRLRGGSIAQAGVSTLCSHDGYKDFTLETGAPDNIGFRCCSDSCP